MQTRKKEIYKTPIFWQLLTGLLVMLCVVIFIMLELGKPRPNTPDPTGDTYEQTENSTGATEDTLPQPEANPIGLGDFAMKDGYLSCLTTPSVLGIDVSVWQGEIDWKKVKAAGVEFAMIRVGWRGSEQGVLATDSYAKANYAGATAAGVKVGAYFFSQAVSVKEAVEEANYLLKIIKDWKVDMPIVFDWEPVDGGSRTANMNARTLTDCAKAFCDTIAAAGYTPMIYFNVDQSFNSIYLRELTEYRFWLAQYNTVLNYPYKIDMWQYTETGSVPGIKGNVDINLYFPWDK